MSLRFEEEGKWRKSFFAVLIPRSCRRVVRPLGVLGENHQKAAATADDDFSWLPQLSQTSVNHRL